jgi:hypothetical protein
MPSSLFGSCAGDLGFDPEQHLEVPQRLFADLAAVVGPQFMELASGVCDASSLGDAALEGGLVAGEPVGHERALPGLLAVLAQEGAHVLAAARLGEGSSGFPPISTAASVGAAMNNIDALIADGGEITIGSVGSVECAATAADEHNLVATLMRRENETVIDLLRRLDTAIRLAMDGGNIIDEINR